MNIKPTRVNPTTTTTTRTSATRSEFRRVRRPTTVCNERVFSAERNTNCALTPFPARRPDPRCPPPPPSLGTCRHIRGGYIQDSSPEMRAASVRRTCPPVYNRPVSLSSLPPFLSIIPSVIFPRASVARVRGTFSRREQTSGAEARGQVVTGCACFLAAERTRARHNVLPGIHTYRAPTR